MEVKNVTRQRAWNWAQDMAKRTGWEPRVFESSMRGRGWCAEVHCGEMSIHKSGDFGHYFACGLAIYTPRETKEFETVEDCLKAVRARVAEVRDAAQAVLDAMPEAG